MDDCLACCDQNGGGDACKSACWTEFNVTCPYKTGLPVGEPVCTKTLISKKFKQWQVDPLAPLMTAQECQSKKGQPCSALKCSTSTYQNTCRQLFICKGRVHAWENSWESQVNTCDQASGVITPSWGFPGKIPKELFFQCKCCDLCSSTNWGGCVPIPSPNFDPSTTGLPSIKSLLALGACSIAFD